jgi:hypothetical protein
MQTKTERSLADLLHILVGFTVVRRSLVGPSRCFTVNRVLVAFFDFPGTSTLTLQYNGAFSRNSSLLEQRGVGKCATIMYDCYFVFCNTRNLAQLAL